MYHLKKNSYIYRGSSNEPAYARIGNSPTFLRNLPVYFANEFNRAKVYGQVVKYKVTNDLHLLNMGDPKVIEGLLNLTSSNTVEKSILKAFRIIKGRVERFSRIKYDIHVAQFICKLGYDGYYAPELKNAKTTMGSFPIEIVLCKPKQVLKVANIYQPNRPPRQNRGLTNNLINTVRRTNYSRRQ